MKKHNGEGEVHVTKTIKSLHFITNERFSYILETYIYANFNVKNLSQL